MLCSDPNRNFHDISSEEFRTYNFPNGEIVMIMRPQYLNVSASGGHRVLDAEGFSHYIPAGWIHVLWRARPGYPNFVA